MSAPTPSSRQAETVVQKRQQSGSIEVVFTSGRSLLLSKFLAASVDPEDKVNFSLPSGEGVPSAPELLIQRATGAYLYQASIGYVTKPKIDQFKHPYVHAEIAGGALGFSGLHLTCAALRDYFYSPERNRVHGRGTLYDVLGASRGASLGDLRLAYKLRELELLATSAPLTQQATLMRAFNILAIPELRACYDALLTDPKSALLFPFSGFGLILVSGVPMNTRFFARRIISFLPERRRKRFKLPLRKLTYYTDRAVYRDSRAKLEMTFDPILMPIGFDSSCNRWKHLLGATIDVEAEFVKTGKHSRRGSQWKLITWETALPSRMELHLPESLEESLNMARHTYQRFGQYSDWIQSVRERLESAPMEKSELENLCAAEGIPADFDVAQINWKADYDPYYYRQLCRRAKRLYLFRDQYIFLTQSAVIVETPQAGRATYIFSYPKEVDRFLRAYARTSKQAIRTNQANCTEQLGFLGRIVHGNRHQHWLDTLRKWLGEPVEFGLTSI